VRREAGFTLIELLCALTILALVLAVCLRIQSGGTRAAGASRDYAQALAVAQAHLLALEARPGVTEASRSGHDGMIEWQERSSPANELSAQAAASKWTAWRLDSRAQTADGRSVSLTSVRVEPKP
jgi:prepilin-type N-terminal cleavage/methylation domain-containing protein